MGPDIVTKRLRFTSKVHLHAINQCPSSEDPLLHCTTLSELRIENLPALNKDIELSTYEVDMRSSSSDVGVPDSSDQVLYSCPLFNQLEFSDFPLASCDFEDQPSSRLLSVSYS
jgi:hypothetical protein